MYELETILWDAYRLRVKQDRFAENHPILSRIPILGLIYKILMRIRNLGKVWAMQEQFHKRVFAELTELRLSEARTRFALVELMHRTGNASEHTPINLYERLIIRDGPLEFADHGIIQEVASVYFFDTINLDKANVVVDIGAHIGAFSVLAKTLNPNAKIIAVEAALSNISFCRANLFGMKDVTIHYAWAGYTPLDNPVLLIDTMTTGSHQIVPLQTAMEYVAKFPAKYQIQEQLPARMTLEEIVEGVDGDMSILKLDCEGTEADILKQAPLTTLQRFMWIVGEYHNGKEHFLNELMPRLSNLFELSKLERGDGELYGLFLLERIKDDVRSG